MGRASMFRGKAGGTRVQGIITAKGAAAFEAAREELRQLYTDVRGDPPTTVSDADVIEYLALGTAATRRYLTDQWRRAERL